MSLVLTNMPDATPWMGWGGLEWTWRTFFRFAASVRVRALRNVKPVLRNFYTGTVYPNVVQTVAQHLKTDIPSNLFSTFTSSQTALSVQKCHKGGKRSRLKTTNAWPLRSAVSMFLFIALFMFYFCTPQRTYSRFCQVEKRKASTMQKMPERKW